jgi:hypothetical protein
MMERERERTSVFIYRNRVRGVGIVRIAKRSSFEKFRCVYKFVRCPG